jgi:hypothetical protein
VLSNKSRPAKAPARPTFPMRSKSTWGKEAMARLGRNRRAVARRCMGEDRAITINLTLRGIKAGIYWTSCNTVGYSPEGSFSRHVLDFIYHYLYPTTTPLMSISLPTGARCGDTKSNLLLKSSSSQWQQQIIERYAYCGYRYRCTFGLCALVCNSNPSLSVVTPNVCFSFILVHTSCGVLNCARYRVKYNSSPRSGANL